MESGPKMIGESQDPAVTSARPTPTPAAGADPPVEIGGRDGPDPTRYGDWEKNGRCVDF
jgi:hypothetical protein